MYKNIVVGFDDSPTSLGALAEITSRVRGDGAHIKLVHAVYHDREEFDLSRGQLDQRLATGRKACKRTAKEFNSEYGVDIETIVCEGDPDKVLVDVASGSNSDIIALGTHGRRGISRLLIGSVTAGVIEKSPCDVLVVNSHCKGRTGEYRNILAAYDGSGHGKKALLKAAELAASDEREMTVLYVIPSYQEMVGFFKTESIKNAIYDEAEKILEDAERLITGNSRVVGTLVQEGHASERIAEMASKLGSELIVMGSHGWTGVDKAVMGSTTERVILNAPCPVLVVR